MDNSNGSYPRHLFDEDSTLNVYDKNVINMTIGAPGPDLLKNSIEMIKKSTKHRLEEEEKEEKYYLFQYGLAAGLWECRNELSKFLTKRYGDPVDRENLIMTCGASHGVQLILNTLIPSNATIFIEEVTYMDALDIFKQFSTMKIISVPMKEDLVDLEAFERIIIGERNHNSYKGNEFWAMFYTIPTFHNPTGMTLPPESCHKLVEIARKYSILIISDDVYNLLYYGQGLPPSRLLFYDDSNDPNYKGGNVISNGSFSKIFCPAIRVGWIECSFSMANILKNSGIMLSSGAVNHYNTGIIASLLQLNLQEQHLNKLIDVYKDRLRAVCTVLNQSLPNGCSYKRPNGGYFIWIHLPSGIDATDLVAWCRKEYKVSFIPGVRFSAQGASTNFLRLSIAFHCKFDLIRGTEALCKGLFVYINKENQVI